MVEDELQKECMFVQATAADNTSSNVDTCTQPLSKKARLFAFMDAPTYKETHSSEVEAYLAADSTDNYPLNFWNNSTKYPGLSR